MSISGLIVQSKPAQTLSVRTALEEIPGVDVHAHTEDGNLVVTVDEPDDSAAADILMNLQNVEGVLAASLIYSHFDGDPSHDSQDSQEEFMQ